MIEFDAKQQVFHLFNDQISYLIKVDEGGVVSHLYFGKRIKNYHGEADYPRVNRGFSGNLPGSSEHAYSKDAILQEIGGNNTGDYRTPGVIVRAANGSTATDFRFNDYQIIAGKPNLVGLPSAYAKDDEAETLILELVDTSLQAKLYLSYTIYQNRAVIARNTRLENNSETELVIEKLASVQLDLAAKQREVISLPGAHVAERQQTRQSIQQGVLQFDSKRGTSSHQMNPFVAIVDPSTNEFYGEAMGILLVYSGNHQFTVEGDQIGQTRVVAGINELNFSWKLAPQASFQTPEALLVYSNQGLNGMSQTYHHLLRERVARGRYQYAERPIVINNWEATMFNFNQAKLEQFVRDAKPLGVEMFVLDDGWFGHRNNDDSSLGDWYPDLNKLPGGLKQIADFVHQNGLQFGVWFEPEMISEDSDLYRAHPDYALHEPGRGISPSRNQFVLDFSRPEVVENIYQQMVQLLDVVPIDYIKWDMNRSLSEVYSVTAHPSHEGEVSHRYVLGLYDLMQRITTRYPNILFEGCSGGGGRFDAGILAYMPQSWTSDNTDPIAREKIQYGTSLVYPIASMTAHVSESPNQQTGRITSIETRGAVAMSGVLGYELDPATLTNDERQQVKQQIEFYQEHRQLIQYGDFIRLKSPFDSNEVAWEFISPDQSEVLLFTFQNLADARKLPYITKLVGLRADKLYENPATKDQFGGDELMQIGLYNQPKLKGDYLADIKYFRMV